MDKPETKEITQTKPDAQATRFDLKNLYEQYAQLPRLATDTASLQNVHVAAGAQQVEHDLPIPQNVHQEDLGALGIGYIDGSGKESAIKSDDNHRPISTIDEVGNTRTFTYDEHGKINELTENGKTYTLTANADGSRSFHYKDAQGVDVDTGNKDAVVGADGTYAYTTPGNVLEIHTRQGKVIDLPGAQAEVNSGDFTIKRADGTRETLKENGALIEYNNAKPPQATEINYPNGTSMSFGYQDGQLSEVTDTNGQSFYRQFGGTNSGHWFDANGRDTGNLNATVLPDGTYAYLDRNNNYHVTGNDGKTSSNHLSDDFKPYPDSDPQSQTAEIARIQQVLAQQPLTADGATIANDAAQRGINPIDFYHGTMVTVQGTQLYDQWVSQLSSKQARSSSHPHDGEQYQVKLGPDNTVVLFGKTEDGKSTWFQTERDADVNLSNNPVDWIAAQASNVASGLGTDPPGIVTNHDYDAQLYHTFHQGLGALGLSDNPGIYIEN